MNWKDLLAHPASLAAAGLSILGIAVKPMLLQAVFAAVWGQAGTIFTAASVAAFSLVPNVDVLAPFQPFVVGVAVISGAVYLAKLGDKIIDEFQRRI